ncbi:MAG: nicotinate (nicotinamide) nucleotide adenylyltransferase [Kiritimatiellae bacterium]|nr:nicotinate (nicotinamide) nucleotide adenylyltransferase [Kiritimatiellia bacterium]
MRRIGIFGGSFNPIHSGHLGIALKALSDWSLDRLYVVPARVSPFKTDAPPDQVTAGFTDVQRLTMVEAACAADPRLVPWTIELDRGGVSYAIDTVRAARERHPEAEVFFVIGEDSVAGLPRWKDWETLRTLCRFVSYPRTRESSTEIRRRLAAGESISDLVPPAVATALRAFKG